MVGERYRRDDFVDGVFRHVLRFFDAVVVYGSPAGSFHFHALHSYASFHFLCSMRAAQPVSLDDFFHLLCQAVVLAPLLLQGFQYFLLGVHVDNVHDDLFFLQEAVTAVNRLNEVVELIVDANEDHAMTMALEVAAASRQLFLCREETELPIGEVERVALALFHILRAVNLLHLRHHLLDGAAFVLEVMPEDEMLAGGGVDDPLRFGDAIGDTLALFARRFFEAFRRVLEHLELAVFFFRHAALAAQLVITDFQFGQGVARIVVTEVGRLLDEERPRGKP